MNIPVLLEPTATGFRASTGAPLNLTAEAPTADEALKSLRIQIAVKYVSGGRIVSLTIPEPDPLIELSAEMAKKPLLDELIAATKDCRREQEAAEAAAEAAIEASRNKSTPTTSSQSQQEPAA